MGKPEPPIAPGDPRGWLDDITSTDSDDGPPRRLIVAAPAGGAAAGPVAATGTDPPPALRSRWRNTAVAAALLAAIGTVVVFLVIRDRPVELKVDGKPIRNASTVLAQAEAAFRSVVESDGARPPKAARCYFAPAPADQASQPRPRAACGPVLLGVSGTDRPWVVGRVSYSSGIGGEMIGRFDEFDAVEDLDEGTLRRPDDKRPAKGTGLKPSAAGIRDEEGRRLLRAVEVLAVADRAFAAAARDAGASTGAQTRCHFGHTPTGAGQRVSDAKLWCGPVLLIDSDPDEPWSSYALPISAGDLFGTAEIGDVAITAVTATTSLAPGVELYRPDGAAAPKEVTLAVPDAAPRQPGFLAVLDTTPPSVTFSTPPDARLVTPARTTTFDGLARTPKIGSGREALVAAPGEDLVVARFSRRRPEGAPPKSESAVVVAGATRLPVPGWSSSDAGTLVVSVPRAEQSVALEVLFDGRAQTISLLTGTRGAGSPAAFYRSATRVGIGQPLDVAVTLPEDQVVRATGSITDARVDGWRRDDGWAPPGQAFLVVGIEDWSVTRPCCKVSKVDPAAEWRLVLPDETVIDRVPPGSSSSTKAVLFVVPEAFAEGRLELSLRVRYEHRGNPGEARSQPVAFALRIPA
ncbi:MAG: hypothetical protein KY458_10295 [Actinobacteria bacterium]|nr:hypothetical protein [Actinomycetota bacterium]